MTIQKVFQKVKEEENKNNSKQLRKLLKTAIQQKQDIVNIDEMFAFFGFEESNVDGIWVEDAEYGWHEANLRRTYFEPTDAEKAELICHKLGKYSHINIDIENAVAKKSTKLYVFGKDSVTAENLKDIPAEQILYKKQYAGEYGTEVVMVVAISEKAIDLRLGE